MAVAENRQLAMPADDLLLPFQTVRSGVRGRIVRLGPVVDTILSRHAYPEPVSHALGEALALAAMLGAALKMDGKFILQTKTDGALDFLVADYETPGKVRGYASFDKADPTLADAKGRGNQGALLGSGHVAMTIDPGGDMDRYQGIVALEREPLVDAAHTYFRQSEQLPTFIRLAVARHYGPSRPEGEPVWTHAPMRDYELGGTKDGKADADDADKPDEPLAWVTTSIAGAIGTLAVFGLAWGLGRRAGRRSDGATAPV